MQSIYHRDLSMGLEGKYFEVVERLQPKSTILEIGCNTGYFSLVLMKCGHEVLGIELDKDAAQIASSNGVNVICGNIEENLMIKSINQKFDVILMMDVVEHCLHPMNVLNSLQQLIKPNGKIMITGPNVAYWSVRKDLLLGRWNYTDSGILDKTHLHFYTLSTWQSLIEDSGYKINVIKAAEGMIPFQTKLLKAGIPNRLIKFLLNLAMRNMPNIFTIVFFIEAIPE
ncbi:class I SAM-dependent methyltransferase [Nodularia sphaerocarpa]|uniref:class I SAM-dependent methyltransferase n=2 Tax=Nodularia sphaerocarpa TaxID=137816 RepID=UPI001EFBDCB1|nr:class I SAM-dependent methyltransferase [Nodularia sphaerocarpa]MDB9375001.1 class I SAM-dependent methyltransferase [Nodularia sphaerocarpa CS-585]ULP74205.1 Ubiquinone biosynthesis O-methyltransferase [Nodularia sphaerocarpa UHCC 0038]